jgi:zinc protease
MVVRAGAVDDPKGKEGLARLTAELMTQGAGSRDARALAEDIAFVGGTLEASGGTEQIVVTCEVLRKDLTTGLELFRDVIVAPTFPEDEVRRKRDEALGEIASDRNDPGTVADQALRPFLFGDGPLGHPPIGWEKSVSALSREDVVGFHDRWVRPDQALLAVVGDVDPKTTIAALEKAFAEWKKSGEKRGEDYAPVPQPRGRHVEIVNKPEVTQTQIRIACMGVPRNHPDYFPIRVANAILGEGFTSRLVSEIRVSQGLTYGISSGFVMYRNGGSFSIDTFTRNEMVRKTVDSSLAEMKKLEEQGPTEEELEKAKRFLTGQFPLDLQAPDALAAAWLDVDFYGLDPTYLETFRDKVDAVTMTDVRRALKSYFCLDDLRILVVSNPSTVRPQLESLGPIEVADPR